MDENKEFDGNRSKTKVDDRDAEIASLREKIEVKDKEIKDLSTQVKSLSSKKTTEKTVAVEPVDSTHVRVDGKNHKILGMFRADNTFVEVKRGHCHEGVTLVAIDRNC